MKIFLWTSICVFLAFPLQVAADQWQKIDDPEALEKIYSNTVLVGVQWAHSQLDLNFIPVDWKIEYCQDGTGQLTFKGQVTPRYWKIKGKDQVCITTASGERCYFYEQHVQYKKLYRNGLVGSKVAPWVFRVSELEPTFCEQ